MDASRSSLRDDYETIAGFYDSGYAELAARRADGEFYSQLAREAQGPVLELGCGTGRVLLEIARLGFPCTGVDASARMLAELRKKDPPRTLRLVHGSMQSFDLGEDRFRLIYAAFRSMQHLIEVEAQLACLACVRRHLAPGGVFAFDVFNPRFEVLAIDDPPEKVDLRFQHEGREVVRHTQLRHDRAAQCIHLSMRYAASEDATGSILGTAEFSMRYFFRFELEHLLARAGFRSLRFYGDFARGSVEGGSDLIVVAQA